MANEPITREEILLNAVATGEQANIKPITREEMFLAKLGGADVNTPTPITRKEQFLMKAVESMSGGSGGGDASVSEKDVNFYDYDGTCLYAYSVEEAQALTELPKLPEHDGLICQGWNWNLDDIKAHNRAVNVGAMYITDDGTTRIYITLHEGRTSPMLGVSVTGTVTVDWGDGTEPDVLTSSPYAAMKWTPNHDYAAAGDYVIQLTVDGTMRFSGDSMSNTGAYLLRHANASDSRNKAYFSAIRKVEIGDNVSLNSYAFHGCRSLESVTIPNSVTTIPQTVFGGCDSLASVTIPDSVTTFGTSLFVNCDSLRSVVIPNSVEAITNQCFYGCYSLASVTIPDSVKHIDGSAFRDCNTLTSVTIPDGVSLASQAFYNCVSIRYYDFTKHIAVPTIADTYAFNGIATDCEIRVPAALYDEWIAATNWATYASKIVAV